MESFQPLSSLPAQLLWHVAGGFRKPASSLSFPVLSRFEIIWKATQRLHLAVRSFSRRWKPLEQCYRMQMRLDSSQPVPTSPNPRDRNFRETHGGGSSLSDIHLHLIVFRPSLTSPCSFSLVRFLVTGKWDSEWMLARIRVYVSCHSMFFFFFFFIGQVLVRWASKMFSCSSYLAIYF